MRCKFRGGTSARKLATKKLPVACHLQRVRAALGVRNQSPKPHLLLSSQADAKVSAVGQMERRAVSRHGGKRSAKHVGVKDELTPDKQQGVRRRPTVKHEPADEPVKQERYGKREPVKHEPADEPVKQERSVKRERTEGPPPAAKLRFLENVNLLPKLLPVVTPEVAAAFPKNVHVKTWLKRSWLDCQGGWLGCIVCRDIGRPDDGLRLQSPWHPAPIK